MLAGSEIRTLGDTPGVALLGVNRHASSLSGFFALDASKTFGSCPASFAHAFATDSPLNS
jgi:hypothetical protein